MWVLAPWGDTEVRGQLWAQVFPSTFAQTPGTELGLPSLYSPSLSAEPATSRVSHTPVPAGIWEEWVELEEVSAEPALEPVLRGHWSVLHLC